MRRRREKRTDYKQRMELLKSGMPRAVVRRAHNNIHIQFVVYEEKGDRVIVEGVSKNLSKYGWNMHGGSLPSAYLTGLMAGTDAVKQGVKEAVLDLGLHISKHGSSLYAAALGIRDAGVKIPLNESVLPNEDRIKGKHIAEYASKIKNDERYKKQFSEYLKQGIEPEKITDIFEEVRKKIMSR